MLPLEEELGMSAARTIGLSHKSTDSEEYSSRIDAINFSLAHDDGQSHKNLANADVILVGVSRSGKTPTSLYLAMQVWRSCRKLSTHPGRFQPWTSSPACYFPTKIDSLALSINPERLAAIRNERLPNSQYASLENCREEVRAAESMMAHEGIRWLSSTTKSIEEIATAIMQEIRLRKQED